MASVLAVKYECSQPRVSNNHALAFTDLSTSVTLDVTGGRVIPIRLFPNRTILPQLLSRSWASSRDMIGRLIHVQTPIDPLSLTKSMLFGSAPINLIITRSYYSIHTVMQFFLFLSIPSFIKTSRQIYKT